MQLAFIESAVVLIKSDSILCFSYLAFQTCCFLLYCFLHIYDIVFSCHKVRLIVVEIYLISVKLLKSFPVAPKQRYYTVIRIVKHSSVCCINLILQVEYLLIILKS